jgi:hypothetical protein
VAFPVLERAILQAQTAHAAMAASVRPRKHTSSSAVVSRSSQST